MDKQTFFLRNEQVRSNCQAFIQGLPADDKKPLVIKIQPMTRNLEQNAKFHAMCQDVAHGLVLLVMMNAIVERGN